MNIDWGTYAAALGGVAILWIVGIVLVAALGVAISLWITYTVIWHGVRRGMREFHQLGLQPAWVSHLRVPAQPQPPTPATKSAPERQGWALSSAPEPYDWATES